MTNEKLDLTTFSTDLTLSEDQIWRSKYTSSISYPELGNEYCFEIEERSFWFNHRNNCIKAVISLYPPKQGQPIFDIGGGNGFVAKGIKELNQSVVLIEPGINGAFNAHKRGVDNVVCSTLDDAGFLPGSLPNVGMFDVLEHIEDDRAFLREVHEYLGEGKLYMTVPAFKWLWSQEDNDAGHYRRYTVSKLKQILNETGFEIDYMSYFFAFLPLPILLIRTIPYFLGIRKSNNKEDYINEHIPKLSIFQLLLDYVLSRELKRIEKKKISMFGGSVILVATKTAKTGDLE